MEMDSLNWSIITALQENARASFADIGRKVGLSAPAVAERIQKMEDAAVIKGYHVALDYEKIGYALTAIITFTCHPEKTSAFLKLMGKMQEVLECYRVTGHYGLFMKVAIKTPGHLEEVIDKFNEYGETTTFIVLSRPLEYRVLK